MGRAIVRKPQVFLFDEPLSNLDAKLRVQMRTEIRELHQRLNSTSIYVTHDQIEAMTMADQIVVMKDGVVEQVGRPLDLYDQPANMFVAGFIGSPAMNLFEGEVADAKGKPVMRLNGETDLPLPPGCKLKVGRKLFYGMRPEHFALTDGVGSIDVRVSVVEPTGAEILVVNKIADQSLLVSFKERHEFKPGQTVRLMPDLQHLHLFDAVTGMRL